MSKDCAASVRARLLNIAKAQEVDFNQVLVRFALERMLYRLSRSTHAERFVLKGADDGIVFDPASITADDIRKEAGYAGARVWITGHVAKARCKTQIDIGFGDAVTPAPVEAVYPVLLEEFPAPRLRTYPIYTVVAEKLHAITLFGMTNTRLKDYLDLSVLLTREALNNEILARAIAATFERRGTPVPATWPVGLTDEFGMDSSRQALWRAFLGKNGLEAQPLTDTVAMLRTTLQPAWVEAHSSGMLAHHPSGPPS